MTENWTQADVDAALARNPELRVEGNCQEKTDSSVRELALNRGRRMGKGQHRTAKAVKDTDTEGASGTAKPRKARGHTESIRLTVGPLPRASYTESDNAI